MSTDQGFIDALADLIEDANSECSSNVLAALRTAIEVFCAEAGFSEEQARIVKDLTDADTLTPSCSDKSTKAVALAMPHRLHS